MKFSYRWLADMVPGLSADPAELERLITMKTAECEGIDRWGEHLDQVVAGRIISVEPVGTGKNKKVVIDAGQLGIHTVVCGAPNAEPGLIAPWVRPGINLHNKRIDLLVIDGVESEGMLASGAEIGVNRDDTGLLPLDISPGEALPSTSDWIIEIDNKSLTHRPDLWGHYGMAREVAAITGLQLCDPVDPNVIAIGESKINVAVEDATLCPRYSALVVENITVEPSPLWLQARLQSVGLNPINNIVDITNYILAELPQPMHAFDADKLHGGITVRRAREGEKLKALNDEEYTLTIDDLVIADDEAAIALAGVIGGVESAISATTTRVVLESANFQAATVRFTSSRHKLRTDASMRFEKSLDPGNTVRGIARAALLLKLVCPQARIVGNIADRYQPVKRPSPVELPVQVVSRKLGKQISEEHITGILSALGFGVDVISPGHLSVAVPSWRATKDIALKEDLVEEVGRMVGYGEITPEAPLLKAVVPPENPMRLYLRSVRTAIAAQGFTELYNYSFVNESQWKRFGFREEDHLRVSNPIAAELTHMRRSLLPGLFDSIVSNARHFREFRVFEIGREIRPSTNFLPDEEHHLAAALYSAPGDEQDFFELKRVLESVFDGARLEGAEPKEGEHPARSAEIYWRGALLGRFFELHPSLLEAEKIEGRAFLFNANLETALTRAFEPKRFTPVRRFPTSAFDLSVISELRQPVARIQDELVRLGGELIVSLEFVRQYAGPPLEPGTKSVSYRVELGAPERTLTSDEVANVRTALIEGMRTAGYELRV